MAIGFQVRFIVLELGEIPMRDEHDRRANLEIGGVSETIGAGEPRPLWHPRAYGSWLEDGLGAPSRAVLRKASSPALPLDTPPNQLPNNVAVLKSFIDSLQFEVALLEGVVAATRAGGDPESANPLDLSD